MYKHITNTSLHWSINRCLKYPCGIIACISQMVDSYILKFKNATLRTVAPANNNYFDLNVATYKKVWTNFELGICLNDSYGNK